MVPDAVFVPMAGGKLREKERKGVRSMSPASRHGVWKVDSNTGFGPRPWASGQQRLKCD